MRMFGIIEGRGLGLRLTPRAIAILEPDFPATADQARLDAFFEIPLYEAFFNAYGNGAPLPDEAGMRNALHNLFGIPETASAGVLRSLLDSADEAGLFRVAGSRTKMIRPTVATQTPTRREDQLDTGTPGVESTTTPVPIATAVTRTTGPRASKIIDGVLDLLPADKWTENELTQWLAFFENALRLYYALPKTAEPTIADKLRVNDTLRAELERG